MAHSKDPGAVQDSNASVIKPCIHLHKVLVYCHSVQIDSPTAQVSFASPSKPQPIRVVNDPSSYTICLKYRTSSFVRTWRSWCFCGFIAQSGTGVTWLYLSMSYWISKYKGLQNLLILALSNFQQKNFLLWAAYRKSVIVLSSNFRWTPFDNSFGILLESPLIQSFLHIRF